MPGVHEPVRGRAVRTLRSGLPMVGILPAVHRAAAYGFVHTGHRPAVAAVRRWGQAAGVPLLDLPALVGEHVFAGKGNPDGMHWGWDAHAEVGAALAALVQQRYGARDQSPKGLIG
jgi:hypothetical protein